MFERKWASRNLRSWFRCLLFVAKSMWAFPRQSSRALPDWLGAAKIDFAPTQCAESANPHPSHRRPSSTTRARSAGRHEFRSGMGALKARTSTKLGAVAACFVTKSMLRAPRPVKWSSVGPAADPQHRLGRENLGRERRQNSKRPLLPTGPAIHDPFIDLLR